MMKVVFKALPVHHYQEKLNGDQPHKNVFRQYRRVSGPAMQRLVNLHNYPKIMTISNAI
jgi:hypothetical protein